MRRRVRLAIHGAVQGVGFRPYVFRLAGELGLAGSVANDAHGVLIEAEGDDRQVRSLLERLPREPPAHARIDAISAEWIDPVGDREFAIRHSLRAAGPT